MNPSARLALFAVITAGCSEGPVPAPRSTDGVRVAVAPLSLPGLSEVCFDMRVTNGPDGIGDVVWSRGTPGLNGGAPDGDALCSSRYGSGAGGDLTYVGPCDADGPDGERMNSVTLWFDGLYDEEGAYLSPEGAEGWRNPCVDTAGAETGCTLNVLCEENADALVQFDFTVMRDANQGFFDVAVNFDDIFCSAKVDCAYPATQTDPARPIELVFDPNTNERVQTVVWAFACTDGDPGGTAQDATHLYMDDLVLDCVDGQGAHTLYTVPAAAGPGNLYSLNAPAPAPLVQAMVFEGREQIQNAGADADKLYWNVALGLNMTFFAPTTGTAPTCTLVTKATASNGPLTDGITPPNASYPYVTVNVLINNGNLITCTQHPLNGVAPHAGVATDYTDVAAGGAGFASATFSNTAAFVDGAFRSSQSTSSTATPCAPNPCQNGGACTVAGASFTCACLPAWSGPTCAQDADGCALTPCFAGVTCTDAVAPLVGRTCGECPMGYEGDGATCVRDELIPTGDPYLAYTSSAWDSERLLDRHHDLDAIYGTTELGAPHSWLLPHTFDNAARGTQLKNLASERVIFRDQRTGAEVWLLARSPADEDVFYTNRRRIDANGSLVRVAGFLSTSKNNHQVRCLNGAISGSTECPYFETPKTDSVQWHPSLPGHYYVDYSHSTQGFGRYLLPLGAATPPAANVSPVFGFPDATDNGVRDLTYNQYHMMVRQFTSTTKRLDIYVDTTPANEFPTYPVTPSKSFPICSRSTDPANDEFGSMEFLSWNGALYARYSLNKGHTDPADTAHPYQVYMFPVSMNVPANCDPIPYDDYLLEAIRARFLVPESEWPDTGHGGHSPTRSFWADNRDPDPLTNPTGWLGPKGSTKLIRDFRPGATPNAYYVDATIPMGDHMDWTVDESGFFVWARRPGTPIYRVDTALNGDDQLKARNVFRVVAPHGCTTNYDTDIYHNTTPDGTKVLYHTNMLSDRECPPALPLVNSLPPLWGSKTAMKNTRDLFMAIVEHPKPPASLSVTSGAQGAQLVWPISTRADLNLPGATPSVVRTTSQETAGYHVYRGQQSGRGYVRITTTPIAQPAVNPSVSFTDPTPGATPHYVVTAVDHAGLESRVFSPEAAPSWTSEVRVFWEAEEGELTAPMREVFLPAECSANFAIARAVRKPDWNLASGDAVATWKVGVPAAGAYTLWVRARSVSGNTASGELVIGGTSGFILTATSSAWTWIKVTRAGSDLANLGAAFQQVSLTTAQSDLEVDKLLLTTEVAPDLTGYANTPAFESERQVSWGPQLPTSEEVTETVSGTLTNQMSQALATCAHLDCSVCTSGVCTTLRISGTVAVLTWTAFSPTTHHYQVYRATSADPSPTQRFLVGSPSKPSFVDPNLPAGTYKYRVQAVDAWGQVSEPSEYLEVTVP